MRLRIVALAASGLAMSLLCVADVAVAATAHNSQAGGVGQSTSPNASTVNSRRVRHAAKHKPVAAAPEADRDAGMYIVKPETPPEYFGHGTGSDGSMPAE